MAQVTTTTTQATAKEVVIPPKVEGEGRRLNWWHIFVYALLLIFAVTSIGPLVFSFISSFKTSQDVLAFPPSLLPNPVVVSNYGTIFADPRFMRWVLNAFIYALGAAVLNVTFSAMAGYALSRMNFPGKNLIFLITSR